MEAQFVPGTNPVCPWDNPGTKAGRPFSRDFREFRDFRILEIPAAKRPLFVITPFPFPTREDALERNRLVQRKGLRETLKGVFSEETEVCKTIGLCNGRLKIIIYRRFFGGVLVGMLFDRGKPPKRLKFVPLSTSLKACSCSIRSIKTISLMLLLFCHLLAKPFMSNLQSDQSLS